MTTKNYRVPLAFAIAALLAAPLVPVSGAESTPTNLTTFHPGAPGEPAWRMLKLEVTEETDIHFDVDFVNLRCPWLLQLALLRGEPGNARSFVGITYNFGGGRTGAQVDSQGPVLVDASALVENGADSCPMGEVDTTFIRIDPGTIYLLYATGGLPSEVNVVASVVRGAARILDESWGYDSYYLTSDGFSGIAHAGVWSPGICTAPSMDPNGGFCDPCCNVAGGFLGGAEASVLRHAEIDFQNRPWFEFTILGQSIANASVTDSEDLTRYALGSIASAGPANVNPMGGAVATNKAYDYPSGRYSFDIMLSATVGQPFESQPHWKIFAIDHWFPEEQ